MKEALKSQYLWTVFFLGMFLLNYPLMAIYNVDQKLAGIPLLYFSVFSIWVSLIGLTYLVVKKTRTNKNA